MVAARLATRRFHARGLRLVVSRLLRGAGLGRGLA